MGLLYSKLREENPYSKLTSVDSYLETLQQNSNGVINTLREGGSFSVDSLGEHTDCILKTKQQVVESIHECKKLEDIWKNEEDLFFLVKVYVDNNMLFLQLCTALNKCLQDKQFTKIRVALDKFEEEGRELGFHGKKIIYLNTLHELKNHKTVGHPLIQEFFFLFQSVYTKQMLMFKKLKAKKSKLVKKWKNLTFAVAFDSVLIVSVVAAVAAILMVLTGATTWLGRMGELIDTLCNKYENLVKGHEEMMSTPSSKIHNPIEIGDLDDCIEALVLKNADFDVREEEGVMVAVDEIKKKLSEFLQTIGNLYQHTTTLYLTIMSGREEILGRFT